MLFIPFSNYVGYGERFLRRLAGEVLKPEFKKKHGYSNIKSASASAQQMKLPHKTVGVGNGSSHSSIPANKDSPKVINFVRSDADRRKMLKKLKEAAVTLFTDKTPPFDKNPLGRFLNQTKPLMNGKTFKTCAVVSSSSLMGGRKLGAFIGKVCSWSCLILSVTCDLKKDVICIWHIPVGSSKVNLATT